MSALLKQWFAAQIFQQGQRVVMTKCCPQLTQSNSLSIVRVGVVAKPPRPPEIGRDCGGINCHVDFGFDPTTDGPPHNPAHCCTCELELFDPST